jgi:hypothetical protein
VRASPFHSNLAPAKEGLRPLVFCILEATANSPLTDFLKSPHGGSREQSQFWRNTWQNKVSILAL